MAVRDARLDVEQQLQVLSVLRVQVKGLLDGQLGVEVVLLDVQAHCEVVVRLVVVLVQLQGFLVVVDGFLVDGDREVGVGQVFEEEVLLSELQASLEDYYRLGVTPQDVQRCGFVVAQQQGTLLGLRTCLQLLQHLVAQVQAVLRLVLLEVEVGKVLSSGQVVLRLVKRGLEVPRGLFCVESEGLQQQGQRLFLVFFELKRFLTASRLLFLRLGCFFLPKVFFLPWSRQRFLEQQWRIGLFVVITQVFQFLRIRNDYNLLLDLFDISCFRKILIKQRKLSECLLFDIVVVMLRPGLFLLDVVMRVLVGLVRQLLDVGLSLLTLLCLLGFSIILRAPFGVLPFEERRDAQANLLQFFFLNQFYVGLLLNVFDIHHLHQHSLLLIDLYFSIVGLLALALCWLVLFLPGELPGLVSEPGVEWIEFLVDGDISGVVGFGEQRRRCDADDGNAKRSVFVVDGSFVLSLGRTFLLRLADHYIWPGICLFTCLALTGLPLRFRINGLEQVLHPPKIIPIMPETSHTLLHNCLILLHNPLNAIQQFLSPLDLLRINPTLLSGEFIIADSHGQFIHVPELLLHNFLILFIFESFIGGKSTIVMKVWVTDLRDGVLADCVDGVAYFCFEQVEVAVDGLLQQPALRPQTALEGVLLQQCGDVCLVEEDSGAHVVVVLLHAGVATRCLTPHAALGCTEVAYFLTVLALIHNIILALTTQKHPLSGTSPLRTQPLEQTQAQSQQSFSIIFIELSPTKPLFPFFYSLLSSFLLLRSFSCGICLLACFRQYILFLNQQLFCMKALSQTQVGVSHEQPNEEHLMKKLIELQNLNKQKEGCIAKQEEAVRLLEEQHLALDQQLEQYEKEWKEVEVKIEEEKNEGEDEQEMHSWIETVQKYNGLPQSAIDSLCSMQFQGGEQEICLSCYQELSSGSMCTYLPCAHLFHQQCIGNHLKISKLCPACMEPVAP